VFVVLSGSEIGFFEREVVNYSASTYGRRAGQLRLEPFKARDVGLFLPDWSAEDRIRAYGVFGNMPYYLAHVRAADDLGQNILDLILMRDGLLHEEARLLLDVELPDASSYFSVLRAIAAGQTRVNQIDQRTGIGDSSRVSQMLDRLQRLWLVRKELPVTVRNPERSRKSFYRITEPAAPSRPGRGAVAIPPQLRAPETALRRCRRRRSGGRPRHGRRARGRRRRSGARRRAGGARRPCAPAPPAGAVR